MILSKRSPEPKPQEGDLRREIKFAWWPKWIGNEKIWLQEYEVVYQWVIRQRHDYFPSIYIDYHYYGGGWDFKWEKIL